ncbi:BZ3500_MvSof-1268-A1-R1_Chr6-3g08964 [Microbotryum saponariae]|uniref:BZ3500_MvSof-1268-A1-R1_Chr6-3g08964 protein n=1 Tax=Microbotryum saponariae TaxID=289078 RepID=A0A2X0KM36_9BASI|nr:BZ3500_MvSof-1268-A1-R1_Chr6-3g08964 [Microbotryum saponariae]SDA07566.1 BZ3501_MvSof-1269-A2-R1_Chr6-2g08668 [Microbotryum saponariae]
MILYPSAPSRSAHNLNARISMTSLRYFNQDKPTYVIPTGDAPLWELSDELVLSKLWPHLDPFGLVGSCVERDLDISLDEQVKHLLNLYDSDFRCDPSFPVIVSNMLRRREQHSSKSTWMFLSEMIKNPKDTKRYKATTEAEKHTNRILAELQSVRDKFHGTTAQMFDMRSGIRGYVNAFGMRIKDKFLDQADTVWANDKKSSNHADCDMGDVE